MKRINKLPFLAVLMLGLGACQQAQEPAPPMEESQMESPAPEEGEAPAGEAPAEQPAGQ